MGKTKEQLIELRDEEENGVPSGMNVHQKLRVIQQQLKAPKNQYNSFGKYKYRSLEDIVEAVKPLMDQMDCILLLTDEIECHGERQYVSATANFVDAVSREAIVVHAAAREADTRKGMDASQITGTASSYARKYALNGLFAIDDTKDADTDSFKADLDMKKEARRKDAIRKIEAAKSTDELLELYKEFLEFKNDEAIQNLFTTKKGDLS